MFQLASTGQRPRWSASIAGPAEPGVIAALACALRERMEALDALPGPAMAAGLQELASSLGASALEEAAVRQTVLEGLEEQLKVHIEMEGLQLFLQLCNQLCLQLSFQLNLILSLQLIKIQDINQILLVLLIMDFKIRRIV